MLFSGRDNFGGRFSRERNFFNPDLYRAGKNFQKFVADADRLKAIPMQDREAFELMG